MDKFRIYQESLSFGTNEKGKGWTVTKRNSDWERDQNWKDTERTEPNRASGSLTTTFKSFQKPLGLAWRQNMGHWKYQQDALRPELPFNAPEKGLAQNVTGRPMRIPGGRGAVLETPHPHGKEGDKPIAFGVGQTTPGLLYLNVFFYWTNSCPGLLGDKLWKQNK